MPDCKVLFIYTLAVIAHPLLSMFISDEAWWQQYILAQVIASCVAVFAVFSPIRSRVVDVIIAACVASILINFIGGMLWINYAPVYAYNSLLVVMEFLVALELLRIGNADRRSNPDAMVSNIDTGNIYTHCRNAPEEKA